jgi:hypothetical protein
VDIKTCHHTDNGHNINLVNYNNILIQLINKHQVNSDI